MYEPDPVIEYYKQFLDMSLIRENLKLTHQQRFEKAQALMDLAEEVRRAGKEAKDRLPETD